MSLSYRNHCNGEWIESKSGNMLSVNNPAGEEDIISHFQLSTAADANQVIDAASTAQPEGAATPSLE